MKIEFKQNGFMAGMNISDSTETHRQTDNSTFDVISKSPDIVISIIALAVAIAIFALFFFLPLIFPESVLVNPILRTVSTICGGIIISCLFVFELIRFLQSKKKNSDLIGMVISSISLLIFIATAIGIAIS